MSDVVAAKAHIQPAAWYARVAYRAYSVATDNKNFRGEEMPTWEKLPPAIQKAWQAAVIAVFHEIGERMRRWTG